MKSVKVLGAAIFYVRVGSQSVVYTGDYNMTPDRHLGAASIERVRPNLLITETTYLIPFCCSLYS
jgi:integrator complex subunit 11